MTLLDTTSFRLWDADPFADVAPTVLRGDRWLGHFAHLSNTSLSMLRRCPRQFYLRYILGQKQAPGESLVIGSMFHETLEHGYRQKISSHEDLPLSETIEYLQDAAVPKVLDEAGGAEEVRWDVGGNVAMAVDRARSDAERITGAYHKTVVPRIQPTAVEQRIEWQPEGFPVPIIGYLDTITDDARIIDTKSGKKVERKVKPSWNMQGLIYANATSMPVEFHSVSRAKTPSICTPLETGDAMLVYPHEHQRQNLVKLLKLMADQIEWYMNRYGPDEEWPALGRLADFSQNMLPCNFCAWKQGCPAWAGEA